MLKLQPDTVLCRLAARGNAGAYDVLYQRYHQQVFAFIFHLLGRRDGKEDAEDIAQDTFTKAFAGIRDKRMDGSFKHWIYTIARNRTFDVIRRRKPVVSLDAQTAELSLIDTDAETAEHVEQRLELAWLMETVAALPERQREALLMREMGGFSHNEIAHELETTVPAVKKLISRGRGAVGDAARADGFRSRNLSRELAMAAPVIPLAAAGIGMTMVGGTAAAGGAAGGAVLGGKTAATALAVVALGGGAVAVESERSEPAKQPATASQRPPGAGQAAVRALPPAPAGGLAFGAEDRRAGDDDRGDDGDRRRRGERKREDGAHRGRERGAAGHRERGDDRRESGRRGREAGSEQSDDRGGRRGGGDDSVAREDSGSDPESDRGGRDDDRSGGGRDRREDD